ncbi:MAG TPA: glycosyltransferase [Candidatus Marinimicrobia bacterium]|nr:glycosyltransferase [Candidatus Neomarinimicrobiota bacterium]
MGHIGVERKNTLSLIRALETIDHPAVIIGKVTDTEEGQACLAETKKNRNLTIIKGLDHDSDLLASAYAAAKVFALPARYETPGIAALEAALAGANIVITPHGGTQDYFREMAIYVDPYSVNDIRAGLERALNAPPDDKLKKHVQSNFLWQRVTEMTANVYQSVLNQ